MEQLSHVIVDRPKSVLAVLLLLTGVFGAYALHLRIDSSAEYLLATDDPNKHYYDQVRAIFRSDDIGVIGVLNTL